MNYLHVELKVCEGCGVLWLRMGKENGAYCTTCVVRLAEFPPAKGKHAGGRPRLARAVGCCAGRRNRDRQNAGAR